MNLVKCIYNHFYCNTFVFSWFIIFITVFNTLLFHGDFFWLNALLQNAFNSSIKRSYGLISCSSIEFFASS